MGGEGEEEGGRGKESGRCWSVAGSKRTVAGIVGLGDASIGAAKGLGFDSL